MGRRLDRANLFIAGWAYVFSMVMPVSAIIFSDAPVIKGLYITFAAYAVMNILFLTRKTGLVSLFVIGAGAVITAVLCFIRDPLAEPVMKISGGILDLWIKIAYFESLEKETLYYGSIFIIIFALVAAAIVIFILKKKFNFFLLTGITFALIFFSWYMTKTENKWLYALFCVLTTASYVRYVYIKKKKKGLIDEEIPAGNLMVSIAPVAFALVFLVSLIPKSEKPIVWPWLDQRLEYAVKHFESSLSNIDTEFFSLSFTGFSDRPKKLGGNLIPNFITVMDVRAEKRTYLRGAAYSWYENNTWVKGEAENAGMENFSSAEIYETLGGWSFIPVNDIFPDAKEEDKILLQKLSDGRINYLLYPTYKLDIRYRNMRLRTLFTPLKTFMPINFSLNRPSDVSEDANGIVTADRKITSAFPYSVSYIQPMYGEQMLKRTLAFSRKNLYRDAMSDLIQKRGELTNELRKEMGPSLPSMFSKNEKPTENTRKAKSELDGLNNGIENLIKLYKRAAKIESDYTKLSRAVPERVKELASSITKDYKSDYEKVAAIENYLRSNYKYTYNPGEVPPGKDFADYFLFEGKNGYCTHFATAMTLLLRSIDIPARYVEGYVLPEKPSEQNIYNVTNNNAHAWVEVYFEGFGWLTFEPTPAYAGTMNYRAIAGTESAADNPFSEIDDLAEKYGKEYKDPGTGASAMAPAAQNNKEMPVYIALFFAALLTLSFSINKASYLLDILKIRASNNNDKIVIIFENLLKWFSSLGYTVRPGETAREFGKRIDQSYYFEEISFEEMSKIFEKARYGSHEASIEDVRIFIKFSQKFKKTALKELGFKRYMPLRYMVLKI